MIHLTQVRKDVRCSQYECDCCGRRGPYIFKKTIGLLPPKGWTNEVEDDKSIATYCDECQREP